jgi:hypothetical protein
VGAVAERAVRSGSRVFVAHPLFAQTLRLELEMSFNFGIEVGCLPIASQHGLHLLGRENALDRRRQPIPLGRSLRELSAPGRRIKARLPIICRNSFMPLSAR